LANDFVGNAAKELRDRSSETGAILSCVAVDESRQIGLIGDHLDDLTDLVGLAKGDFVIEPAEQFAEPVLSRSAEETTQDAPFAGLIERDVNRSIRRLGWAFSNFFRRTEIADLLNRVIAQKYARRFGESPRIIGTIERVRFETGDRSEIGNGYGQVRYARRSCRYRTQTGTGAGIGAPTASSAPVCWLIRNNTIVFVF